MIWVPIPPLQQQAAKTKMKLLAASYWLLAKEEKAAISIQHSAFS
jgi:hypothetical protein